MWITKTSEKTVEINILHDLCNCLESKNQRVTVIAPTQREERDLSFDDMFEGLPAGRVLALQFKRPYEKNKSHVRFNIPKYQLRGLLDRFPNIGEAYYVFSPFPYIDELVDCRSNLLAKSYIFDIQNKELKKYSKTQAMTLEIEKSSLLKFRIIDNRISYDVSRLESATVLCPRLVSGNIGRKFKVMKNDNIELKYKETKELDNLPGRTSYIHISKNQEE